MYFIGVIGLRVLPLSINGNGINVVKVVSYNMHGYNQGSVLLPTLCKDFKIIFIQEHWLLPVDLDKIVEITNDEFVCFSKSAMDNRICRGVLAGRPYGGGCPP